MKTLLRTMYTQVKRLQEERLLEARTQAAQERITRFSPPYKFNIGSGKLHFDGCVNLDRDMVDGITDIQWDATQPFPFCAGSCEIIYTLPRTYYCSASGFFSAGVPPPAHSRWDSTDCDAFAGRYSTPVLFRDLERTGMAYMGGKLGHTDTRGDGQCFDALVGSSVDI